MKKVQFEIWRKNQQPPLPRLKKNEQTRTSHQEDIREEPQESGLPNLLPPPLEVRKPGGQDGTKLCPSNLRALVPKACLKMEENLHLIDHHHWLIRGKIS